VRVAVNNIRHFNDATRDRCALQLVIGQPQAAQLVVWHVVTDKQKSAA